MQPIDSKTANHSSTLENILVMGHLALIGIIFWLLLAVAGFLLFKSTLTRIILFCALLALWFDWNRHRPAPPPAGTPEQWLAWEIFVDHSKGLFTMLLLGGVFVLFISGFAALLFYVASAAWRAFSP